MGRVGNRAEVTYSVTLLSRLRRRRGIGRQVPTVVAMAPLASPLFRPTHHPPGGTSGPGLLFWRAWVILSLRGRGWRHVAPRSEYPLFGPFQIRQLASRAGPGLADLKLSY